MQKIRITQRSRPKKERKSEKQKSRTKQAKANPEQNPIKRHAKRQVWFGENEECDEGKARKETDETTPGCVDRVACVVRGCDGVWSERCGAFSFFLSLFCMSGTKINGTPFFFVLFEAATQLARQVHQERTQVVCSNKVDRNRLALRHSRY